MFGRRARCRLSSRRSTLRVPEALRPSTQAQQALERDGDLLRDRFSLTYHVDAMRNLARRVRFADNDVLEIGGALPEGFVLDQAGAHQWTAVNFYGWGEGHAVPEGTAPLASASDRDLEGARYHVFDGRAEDLPECFARHFDVVCSINAFEHIHNIWKSLDAMYSSLRPGGLLVATFGPVWSGRIGHHVWIDESHNFNTFSELPDYLHLTHTKRRCRDVVRDAYGPEIADRFVQRAFFDPVVNRLFVEDYADALEASPFQYWELSPWGVEEDPSRLCKLRSSVGDRVFALGLDLVAQKAADG